MKLHQTPRPTIALVTGFGDDYLQIGERRVSRTVLLAPGLVRDDWGASRLADLSSEDFAAIVALDIQILLLGTGPTQQFPHPSLLRPLIDARIGVEVMDTLAAARTYNILVSEGRAVAAALLLDPAGGDRHANDTGAPS
ncbi:Mth938-like domain-containing protein [Methyloversatilis thermotolerans]|uniref:Mth938-like domain-containing protein n=1 Tax=Methyloversatilis thermotolerans TaxID=1346290 RepID=UPI000368D567|nr:Mth938-like domain-containing protein [Methyloversatilis thermotolerans]